MTKKLEVMDGCNRCPHCHLLPTVTFYTEFVTQLQRVSLTCDIHHHEALGDDVEMAVKNWNLYLHYYTPKVVA